MDNTVQIQGLPVFYRDKGQGAPILILHGWDSKSDTWVKVQGNLVNAGFRVIIPDLPGFGQTPQPPRVWSLKDYCEFIHEFTHKLNVSKITLAGHSFGGRISLAYCVRYPEDLDKLVLIATAGIKRYKQWKVKIFLFLAKIGNVIFSVPILKYFKSMTRKVAYKLTGGHDYEKASPRMRGIMKNILNEDLRAFLPQITIPTLILWGNKDKMTPVKDARILNTEVKNSHLYIFPNQPHALQLTMPEELASRMADFLKIET
ncbi:MAG: hypothetical protein A3A00_00515 [Candidatus Spechtbacteria bacterium RIFCSPLOWO2_01_FULL_38_20]|nr:MAG: hypothetical protein A2728_01005 [Candidatus Spechtbacteria bacterium RIFCSPHIGHO2_01_FULL_38_11]OGZ59381.1 MAG: hypothetical protein A3A00_00515 [Candidatus Spechtbacteria bacterium RIFCSPLOWO2_01_FULL_38_20]